jgi:hypothetical protein
MSDLHIEMQNLAAELGELDDREPWWTQIDNDAEYQQECERIQKEAEDNERDR